MKNPFTSLTHRERAGLAVAVGVLALFGTGSALYRSQSVPLQPTVFPAAPVKNASPRPPRTHPHSATPAPKSARASAPTLVVYVSGAVLHPGVYRFPAGQRLFQAIQKAGGFKKDAQQDALNLAEYLKDADQVHVPASGAPAATVPPPASRPGLARVLGKAGAPGQSTHARIVSTKFHNPGEGKVKLNSATLEELQKLPGVGPSTAQSIMEYRKKCGSFQELEELKEVRGIGEKKFAKMQPFLSL